MPTPIHYSFTRYLAAKKSLDDRSLNKDVWQALSNALPPGTPGAPLRILEIGAGIGTMFERALDWGLFRRAEYTALDAQPENIAAFSERLSTWAARTGAGLASLPGRRRRVSYAGREALLDLQPVDLFDFIARETGKKTWDLLIAHAFLDLVDLPSTLPQLFRLASPAGWFYFTLNFDGATLFEPPLDPALDEHIQQLYHHTMDERLVDGRPSGDSRAGRHLFEHLRNAGARVLAAGASDWVVFPGPSGYPGDEAYFLHFIVHTLGQALRDHPGLEPGTLRRWLGARHAQIERGKLVYIAHQLDFFGQYKDNFIG